MRVLTVGNRYPPWSSGGYEVVWASAVDALRRAGATVRVLTTVPDPSDLEPGASHPQDVHRDLRWYWRKHEFPSTSVRAAVSLEHHNRVALARHLQTLNPDVVVWWGMGGMSLSLIEQVHRQRIPAVGVVGDEWMLYGPEVDAWTRIWRGRARPAAELGERLTGIPARLDLDRGARWLFNCEYLLSAIREGGWSLPDAGILAPGVDSGLFTRREPEPWRWRLLYCGRVDPRKGIATAIEALRDLPQEATLTIHGDGSAGYLAELRSVATRVGVAERVSFQRSDHGDVAAVYAQSDAVVFPVTWREPWGLVPLEAMAVGRPVLASRAGGGPAEYLEDERNCLQFAPGDGVGLAHAVLRLASQDKLREALIEGGRLTASRFTEASFNDGLRSELEGVLTKRPAR